MSLLKIFSMLDWISGVSETIDDVNYTISTGELATPIPVDDVDEARAKLREAGVTVVSVTRGGTGFVDVPDDEVDKARSVLG